jgi:hypothetical protein
MRTGVQLVSLVDEQVASDMASTVASEVHDLLKVSLCAATHTLNLPLVQQLLVLKCSDC